MTFKPLSWLAESNPPPKPKWLRALLLALLRFPYKVRAMFQQDEYYMISIDEMLSRTEQEGEQLIIKEKIKKK
jgi:hypothetical protein